MYKMVKVVTLNVGRLIPFLNRFFPIRKSSIEKVKSKLKEIDADIILLQEVVGQRHLEELVEGTGYYSVLGPPYENERYLENVALLSNREIREINYVPESNAISVLIPDYNIDTVNVHLSLRRKKRLKQIKSLLSKIKLRRTILGGDFNDYIGENPIGNFHSCTYQIGSTTLYGRHIDDILHTPDVRAESAKIVNSRFGLMDHYPVMAIVS